MLFADVTRHDMSISGFQQTEAFSNHLSADLSAIVRDGLFKGQEIMFQLNRKIEFDTSKEYVGALIQSKPSQVFIADTDSERFGHLVTLITGQAIKEIILNYEPPKHGKAKLISWHVSTTIEE